MEDKSSAGVLKEHMIYQKTHTTSLADVRTLNMWGYELLDVSIIERMPNLETISLSLNKITTLKPFGYCYNLKSLFLRQNNISDLHEVNYLRRLPNLRSLMLRDNPISENPNYRSYIVQALPQLEKLDDVDITSGEKHGRVQSTRQQYSSPHQQQLGDFNKMRMSSNRGNSSSRAPLEERKETWQDPNEYVPKQNYARPIERRPIMQKVKSSSADDSMLAAVLALIPELSDESIQIVLDAIRNRGN
jgi:hypothetical protein